MITSKDAAQKAFDYLKEIYTSVDSPLIEEIEKSEDGNDWHITLSFLTPADNLSIQHAFSGGYKNRTLKIFVVDGKTGEVKSMKIRSAFAA